MSDAAAGWYPDPTSETHIRWWDGEAWTEVTRRIDPEPTPDPAPVYTPPAAVLPPAPDSVAPPVPTLPSMLVDQYDPAPAGRPWWKKKRFIIPGGVIVLLGILGALAPDKDDPEATAAETTSTTTADQEVTATSETEATTTTTAIETTTTTAPPPPEPVVLSGSGDQVVPVAGNSGLHLARISHDGSRNFAIVSYDASGNRIDQLVNVIGAYEGSVLVDVRDGEQTAALEVTASGNWSVTFLAITEARKVSPSSIEGVGDDVVVLEPAVSGFAAGTFSTDSGGNFAVIGFSSSDRDLLVNEIGPYSGQAVVAAGTTLLEVKSAGAWTIVIQ